MSTEWEQPALAEGFREALEALEMGEPLKPIWIDIGGDYVMESKAFEALVAHQVELTESKETVVYPSDFTFDGNSLQDLAEEASLVLEQIKAIEEGEPLYFESQEGTLEALEGEAYYDPAGYLLTTECDNESDVSLRFMVSYLRTLVDEIAAKMEESYD